jgi:DNA-directed RNA polymerase specialized sigma24 family protein
LPAGGEDDARRVEALRARILAAAGRLLNSPRQEKFYQALRLTYFEPAPTQEIASERLGVPFRTFRRHLKSGIQHLTETLWRWEVGLEG